MLREFEMVLEAGWEANESKGLGVTADLKTIVDSLGIMAVKMQAEVGAAMLKGIITIVISVVVLGAAVPVLWPMIADSDTEIQAMTGTDEGTGFIQKFWPVMILIGGIGLGVGILLMVMKKFKLGG